MVAISLDTDGDSSKTPDSDALIARVSEGDVVAFEMLYDRYWHLVLCIAQRICLDPYIAEDEHQEVFLKVWRSPEQYRQGCLAAWLSRVTRNQSIDALRKRSLIANESPVESVFFRPAAMR